MLYTKVNKDGAISKYPYVFSDLKKDNPLTSFPRGFLENSDGRSEYGIEEVIEKVGVEKHGHDLVEGSPERVDGNLTQSWSYTAKEKEEMVASEDGVKRIPKPEEREGYFLWTSYPTEHNPQLEGDNVRFGPEADLRFPEYIDGEWCERWTYVKGTWLENRIREYGGGVWTWDQVKGYEASSAYQLEYIVENGLDAWAEKVAEIKAKYPKE